MTRPRLPNRLGVPVLIVGLLAAPATALSQVSQASPNSPPPGVTMETIEQGQAIFEGKGLCTTCHGPTAEGAVGPDLTDNDWLQAKGSYLAILQVVLAGVPEVSSSTGTGMPSRGDTDISDADVQSAAAYVWRNSHPAAGDSLPTGVTDAMVQRGEQVFLGAGGCALCHGSEATGLVGPDLTDDVWLDWSDYRLRCLRSCFYARCRDATQRWIRPVGRRDSASRWLCLVLEPSVADRSHA